MIYGYSTSSYSSIANCVSGGWTEEQCMHWSVGTYYSPYIAHGDSFESSTGQTEMNTICPGRWTLPTNKELEGLIGSKKLSVLYEAPYYMTAAGLYGLRTGASDFTQWFVRPAFITYLNKDGNTISSYPSGLTVDNIYTNPSPAAQSSKRVTSTNFGYFGATVRCIARRGY